MAIPSLCFPPSCFSDCLPAPPGVLRKGANYLAINTSQDEFLGPQTWLLFLSVSVLGWAVVGRWSLHSNEPTCLFPPHCSAWLCLPSPSELSSRVGRSKQQHHSRPGTVLGSGNLGMNQSLALLSRNSLPRGEERPQQAVPVGTGRSHKSACGRSGGLHGGGGQCS